jgi:hypothetical protein
VRDVCAFKNGNFILGTSNFPFYVIASVAKLISDKLRLSLSSRSEFPLYLGRIVILRLRSGRALPSNLLAMTK